MAPTPIPAPPPDVDFFDGRISFLEVVAAAGCLLFAVFIAFLILAIVLVRSRHKPEYKAEQVRQFGGGQLKDRYSTLGELPAPATAGLIEEEPPGFKWPKLRRRGGTQKAQLAAAEAARPEVYDPGFATLEWAKLGSTELAIIIGRPLDTTTKEKARA